jgi:hypothetical protein
VNEQQIIEKALDVLENVGQITADMKPDSAMRLEALALSVKQVPFESVANLSIGWVVQAVGDEEELCPTLHITMKGELP